jgi:hypothetical protein
VDQARAPAASGDCAAPLSMMRKKIPSRKAKPKPHPKLPNREAILSKMPRVRDSGRILEEDRS